MSKPCAHLLAGTAALLILTCGAAQSASQNKNQSGATPGANMAVNTQAPNQAPFDYRA